MFRDRNECISPNRQWRSFARVRCKIHKDALGFNKVPQLLLCDCTADSHKTRHFFFLSDVGRYVDATDDGCHAGSEPSGGGESHGVFQPTTRGIELMACFHITHFDSSVGYMEPCLLPFCDLSCNAPSLSLKKFKTTIQGGHFENTVHHNVT